MKRLLIALLFAAPALGQNVPYSDITLSSSGRPVGGAPIAVCSNPGLTTTSAQVISNIAVLTMSSNPITAGFVANQAIAVSGFTGADTYFNGGTVTSTGISNNFLILSVTSTQITYALTHANASATTNGSVFQSGSQSQACAPLAAITSDSSGLVPITQPGLISTGLGNYQFYAVANAYYVQFYGATIGEIIKPVTLPCAGPAACVIASPGSLTVSGTGTFTGANTFKNLSNIRYVSPTNLEGWPGATLTAQINAAAADLGGPGTVYFRSGAYTIPSNAAGSIQLLSNVQFACTGFRTCTLNGPSFVAGDFFFFSPASVHDCYVGGFVMVGGSTTVDNRGITNNNGTTLTRCLFENNDISNTFDGIDAANTSNDNTIRNNYIHGVGQQGMTVNGSRNQLLNNRIDTVGTTNLHHGMYVQDGDSNTIIGNIISNVFGFCIHNFSTSTTSVITSTRIMGNSCISGGLGSGTRGGIAFAETPPSTGNRQGILSNNTIISTNGNPIYISAVTDAVVSNNTIRVYQGDCIDVQGSNGFTTTNVKINGNICKTQSVTGNGIRVLPNGGGVANIDIENNQIDTVFGIAIWLQSCTDCKVVNNRVKDWNVQGSASNAGINIDAGTLRTVVQANSLSTANTTGNPPAINLNATASDNEVSNNILLNFGSGSTVADAGTRTHNFGNVVNITDNAFLAVSPIAFASITDPAGAPSGQGLCWFSNSSNSMKCNMANTGVIAFPASPSTTLAGLAVPEVFTANQNFPGNTVALTADWTCGTGGTVASCTSATIIGSGGGVPLTFTLPLATQSYTLECDGVVGQATAATLNQWNLLTATNGATNVTANYSMATAATASAYGAVTDQASTTTTFQITPSWTLGGTATKMPFHIWAKIEGASASGTVVSLQLVAPTVADLVTIFRGTACRVF